MLEEEQQTDQTKDTFSRRNFLVKAGALTGLAAAGGMLGSIAASADPPVTTIPWPYVKLDTEVVRKKGFETYINEGGCCIGAAKGLIAVLREKLPGSQWDAIPDTMFKYGAGGVGGSWGTLCGALNGALYVINLACGSVGAGSTGAAIGNELIGWYTKYNFPTPKLDTFVATTAKYNGSIPALNADGTVKDDKNYNYANQARTIADTPLCHTSVSVWCTASGATVGSNAKKARCGKLTGDVAAKAAELLNKALVYNKYKSGAQFKQFAEANFCLSCHYPGNSNSPTTVTEYQRYDEQGKMKCGECHDDVAKHDHNTFIVNDCDVCHK